MGVVYLAEDMRLGREVAVKLLRADALGSADSLARFEREARLASALQHPNICTIHELGEHEGQPFIAMERLEGMTLRRFLERGAIPPARVLEFARQIADALDAAHRRGMIHRDVKPANLFITDGDCLKILDFGVARTTRPTDSSGVTAVTSVPSAGGGRQDGTDLTRTGMTVGTVAYMSPEQALGQPLDARTDLFSVGTAGARLEARTCRWSSRRSSTASSSPRAWSIRTFQPAWTRSSGS
jgi:serine/threonine protein kinase